MKIEKQIDKWKNSGLITKEQAQKMLEDVTQKGKEERSNKFIIVISVIGSICLGIGAILFIASNWEEMSDLMKVFILLGSTFAAYCLGFLFKYQKKILPKVGASLIFLGALLFGASVILIAQIYNMNANTHSLVLIWLVGILPLVYAFRLGPIAVLSSLLFFIWVGCFIFREVEFDEDAFLLFPVIYLSAGASLFSIGGLHYFKDYLKKIARIFRISGIQIAMFALFLMTFEIFSGDRSEYFFNRRGMFNEISSQITTSIVLFSILAIIGLVINLFFNPAKSPINAMENGTTLALVGFTLLFFFFPAESNMYTVIYNLIFAALTIFILAVGYKRADIKIVNIGIFWTTIFLVAKYFDFFFDLLDRSIFFLVGGLILVLGGIALEKKRKEIKKGFSKVQMRPQEQSQKQSQEQSQSNIN
jgi:uncharacterized membrane protein